MFMLRRNYGTNYRIQAIHAFMPVENELHLQISGILTDRKQMAGMSLLLFDRICPLRYRISSCFG